MSRDWKTIRIREDAELQRKEWFTYQVGASRFNIELFETARGDFYAIGTPADSSRLFIYGSSLVSDAALALEQAIKKINRDHDQADILAVGEDVRDDDSVGDE
ncbi:MAG: hypothetical protein ACYCVB_09870 [Bacilli bacterium]